MSDAGQLVILTELVEHMKYSITADDAFVFLLDLRDGNFHLQENKETATHAASIIHGDHALIQELRRKAGAVSLGRYRDAAGENALPLLKPECDTAFPIMYQSNLFGLLTVRRGQRAPFDEEDLRLIEVFTNTIGEVLFRNKVLRERIQAKQFESFSHVASFIIHDIKNQVATLSLVMRNADANINNPQFQQSLLRSVKSASDNLRALVDKLQAPPRQESLQLSECNVNDVLREIVDTSGMRPEGEISLEIKLGNVPSIHADRTSLYYIAKNLVTNACEAMSHGGRLRIVSGPLHPLPLRLKDLFGGGVQFFSAFALYILIEDTGCGMDKEFIEERLFHPFSTTKDKGVGIGLYQCKTLIERMNGRILCHSEVNRGTEFCVLL
jgi:hypothetical protein